MQSEKVHLKAEQETMLFTLFGKALQSRSKDPILPDLWAEDAVSRIDYDFRKLKMREYESRIIAVRSRQFDLLTIRYLAENLDATVLHLGCGMDSRVFRVNPPASVRWFDVDYPEVIALRQRLYPERAGYRMIGTALQDADWLDDVPADRPAMIVAEGLMMYLTDDIVRSLLNRLTGHFPGGHIVFDAWNRLALRSAQRGPGFRGIDATFGWAIDDPDDIKKLNAQLKLITEITARDLDAFSKMPWWSRTLVCLTNPIPALRRANRILLYRF